MTVAFIDTYSIDGCKVMAPHSIYQAKNVYLCIDKINRTNPMTLQQFRYIVAIDEYRHFGKAAEACGLTQSTLSLMVKKLEEELDVILFDRGSHPVSPTGIGRQVIDKARVILYHADQLAEMTRTEKNLLSGPLRIALISTVAPILVPGLFKYIGTNHPAVSLQTQEMLTDTIWDRLRKTEIDMGILSAPVKDPDFLEIPLWTEHFLAYVSGSDPLFAKESIPAESLLGRSIWIMKDGVRLWEPDSIPLAGEVEYEHYFEGGRIGTLIQIVNENGGVTVVPETHVGHILYSHQDHLRRIVEPELNRTISLVIRKEYIHEALLNVVLRAVKSVIPGHLLSPVVRKDRIRL